MAEVRVYLCTYRRNALLRRAVASLQSQTFQDWVCELHNDDPADPFPGQLVAGLGDNRISIVVHPANYGPTKTFNLMYDETVSERYVSLLEDDNWWETGLLERLTREMGAQPTMQVAWANMRLWEEMPGGNWRDTGRLAWGGGSSSPILFDWPHPRQLLGGIHSHGAMLLRTSGIDRLRVPDETPSAIIECVRERMFRYPIMLVPEPLANFAITRSTSRGGDRSQWGQCQALLAASYLRHVRPGPEECRKLWADARAACPPATAPLITAGLIDSGARYTLRYSRLMDWIRFAAGFVRRPVSAARVLRAKAAYPEVWATLNAGTRDANDRAGRLTGSPLLN